MATGKDLINDFFEISDQHNLQKLSTNLIQIGNSRKKKYEYMEGFQDVKRKKVKDVHILRKSVPVPAISSPYGTQVCKCSHQCHKLTSEDKLALFNLYHKKSYDEQSEYIIHYCMSLIEPKKRKVDKAISQRQSTFLYQLQLGPKIVSVCQRTLCSVLSVTPRRIQVLQNKMKNSRQVIDHSGQKRENDNKLYRVNEVTIRKIQKYIIRHKCHYYKETLIKKSLNPELTITKLYKLFCNRYPELQVSREIINDLWKETNTTLSEADLSEDLDDPVNDRLNYENNFSIVKNKAETVRDSLEAEGQLGRIKAEMRTEVLKLLDGSSKVKKPKSPHDVLLLNELIREYLDWIGYKYTSNVLVAECELGKQPLDRSFLAQDLGVKETDKSQSLPLLFCLIETFKELKATSMTSC